MITEKTLEERFVERLAELTGENSISHSKLRKAIQHILFAKGKLLRPKLLLSIAKDSGIDAACAIEMLHTYSLIHDDLPCMDDDKTRRGKPAVHIAFDEALAVLAGDALLTYTFETIANSYYSDNTKVKLLSLLGKRAGPNGMIFGQCLDVGAKEGLLTWTKYQTLALRKTADLFSASLEMGAIIQDASEDETLLMRALGHSLGLIYQLVDDLDDDDATAITKIYEREKIYEIINLLTQNALNMCKRSCLDISYVEQVLLSLTKRALV